MIHDVFLHVLIGVKAKGVTALLVKRLSIAGLVAFKIQERERKYAKYAFGLHFSCTAFGPV